MAIPHAFQLPVKKAACPTCSGSGQAETVDNVEMRRLREASGRSLRGVARILKISPTYLSDMELGNRGWNLRLAEAFLEAIT